MFITALCRRAHHSAVAGPAFTEEFVGAAGADVAGTTTDTGGYVWQQGPRNPSTNNTECDGAGYARLEARDDGYYDECQIAGFGLGSGVLLSCYPLSSEGSGYDTRHWFRILSDAGAVWGYVTLHTDDGTKLYIVDDTETANQRFSSAALLGWNGTTEVKIDVTPTGLRVRTGAVDSTEKPWERSGALPSTLTLGFRLENAAGSTANPRWLSVAATPY